MYRVIVELKDIGLFDTFAAAFPAMYQAVKEILQRPAPTYQTLETACWIEYGNPSAVSRMLGGSHLDWYNARDLAYSLGIMSDGKLVSPCPDVDDARAARVFRYGACILNEAQTTAEENGEIL